MRTSLDVQIDSRASARPTICPQNGLQLADKSLLKSGECALHVAAEAHYGTLTTYFNLICNHIHRWKVAELTLQQWFTEDLGERLKSAPAPQLRKLTIRTPNGELRHLDHELFHAETESLQELDIAGVSLPWTSTLLHGLRILRLAGMQPIEEPSTSRFLAVVQQCPDLEELCIRDLKINQSDDSELPGQDVILARLRSLELSWIKPPTSAISILTHISSPRYDRLILLSSFSEPAPTDIFVNAEKIRPSLDSLISRVDRIQVGLQRQQFYCTAGSSGSTLYFSLSVWGRWPREAQEWALTMLHDAMTTVDTDLELVQHYPIPPDTRTDIAIIKELPF
ncbi:hypothetical protein FRB99_000739 [Tulasnella sp. 403]|nr:hypothetical protein FRB99_000739 [Tulasnella sp. 403]